MKSKHTCQADEHKIHLQDISKSLFDEDLITVQNNRKEPENDSHEISNLNNWKEISSNFTVFIDKDFISD